MFKRSPWHSQSLKQRREANVDPSVAGILVGENDEDSLCSAFHGFSPLFLVRCCFLEIRLAGELLQHRHEIARPSVDYPSRLFVNCLKSRGLV